MVAKRGFSVFWWWLYNRSLLRIFLILDFEKPLEKFERPFQFFETSKITAENYHLLDCIQVAGGNVSAAHSLSNSSR